MKARNAFHRTGFSMAVHIGRRESGGRDLIEQRLDKMVVALIDHGDVERLASEALGRGKPAKADTNDYHAVATR